MLYDGSTATFHFTNISADGIALQERNTVKDMLAKFIQHHKPKPNKELEEKTKLAVGLLLYDCLFVGVVCLFVFVCLLFVCLFVACLIICFCLFCLFVYFLLFVYLFVLLSFCL